MSSDQSTLLTIPAELRLQILRYTQDEPTQSHQLLNFHEIPNIIQSTGKSAFQIHTIANRDFTALLQ
jgi:hypothetical protein